MSYSEQDLKRMLGEVIDGKLKVPSESTEERVKHACDCPNCFCGIVEKMKNFKYQCADCGLPFPDSIVGKANSMFEKSNDSPCPNCGSVEAVERENRGEPF